MTDRRDIPDALRDAVERTVQATIGTRELAQGAASELSASVDELVKGAEKGLSRSRRTVRAAVEERLPATQDDVKAIRTELRRLGTRLAVIEERLADMPRGKAGGSAKARTPARAKPAAKGRSAAGGKPAGRAKAAGKAKTAGKAETASRAKPRSARSGTRAKPQR